MMISSMGREPNYNYQRPRVSVVIIFLNEEAFLQEAVDSVLSQTFKEWELLVVDDGSTDGSSEIAYKAARRLPQKIHLLEHERHGTRGMSASRNLGLKYARGEYVLFLDGDDVLTPTALSEQVALMEAHPEVGTVYGPMRWWFGWDGDPHEQRRDFTQKLSQEPDTAIEGPTVVANFLRDEGVTPSGNLFRTSLVRDVGGFEDKFRGMCEDQVFRVKFCLRFPVYAASRVWYKYRRHAGSCCAKSTKNEYDEARGRFLRWTEDFCRQRHVSDARVWKALREALRPYRYPRLTRFEHQVARYKARFIWRIIETASPVARRVLPRLIRERIWDRINSMKSLH